MDGIKLPVQINTMRLMRPRLDVYYPQVAGLQNLAAERRINKAILDTVDYMIREQGYYQNPRTEITASYELKTNERDILSLSLINYAFSGGAHGLTIIKSLTMDVETGKVYALKDLFKPGSDYVKRLSDIIYEQIVERDIPLLDGFKGIRPDQDFYVADKALVVYFQLYEIAAYVYGILAFPISVYEIDDIISEQGPLDRMLY